METHPPRWQAVDPIARRQHGLISLEQLHDTGFTRSMVRTALRTGRLTDVHPGVFRAQGAPGSHLQLIHAATLCAGAPAAAAYRSAAHLWQLRRDLQRVEIVVPHERRFSSRNVTVYRSVDFDPNHFTNKAGVRVTKPARTIVDLAAVLGSRELAEVVDRALVLNLVSQDGLRVMIAELARPGRRGPSTLRRLLDEHPLAGVSIESVIEPVMAAILQHSPIAHRFVYQHRVILDGEKVRMDFAAPHVKVGVEVLGLREHGTRQAVIDDSNRRRRLRLHGWDLLEYTKDAMIRSPTRVARELSAYVEDRERQFPGWNLLT